MSYLSGSSEGNKICSVPFNMSEFIGRGRVKESLQLTGSAYYVDFEILVEPDFSGDVRGSMAMPGGGDDHRMTMQPQSSVSS